MKKTIFKGVSIALVLTLLLSVFTACQSKKEVVGPTEAKIKTDIGDVIFTFTYGDLRQAGMPGDKLASLFENTNKKTDDKTVSISYYELVSKFGGEEYFNNILKLIPTEDFKKFNENEEAVLNYFNALINDIKTKDKDSLKVYYDERFWINHGDGVVFADLGGNKLPNQKELRAAFRLYADKVNENIKKILIGGSEELYEGSVDADGNIEFIENPEFKDIFYVFGSDKASTLTVSDLYRDNEAKIYPAYSSLTPTWEFQLDEKGNNAKDEDGEYIFVPTEWYRTVNICVKPEKTSVSKAFSTRTPDEVLKYFDVAKDYMTVNSYDVKFEPCTITAGINAVNDQMTYCAYTKNMVVTMNVTFTGALEKYGNMLITFPCVNQMNYEIGWKTAE